MMKTVKKVWLFCAVCALAATGTSCQKEKLAEEVKGNYCGYTLAQNNYFSDYFTAGESLSVTKTGDDEVKVSFVSPTWGSFVLEGVTVKQSGKNHSLSGNGKVTLRDKEYACSLTANVGSFSNANFTFEVPGLMAGGTRVVFHTGTASTGYYVAGTYKGSLSMTVSGNDYGSTDTSITLKGESGNKVSIALPAVGSGKMSIPSVTLTDIPLTTSDYQSFSIPSTEVAFTDSESGTRYAGTLEGRVSGEELHLSYSLKPGAMPMSIDFTFGPVSR